MSDISSVLVKLPDLSMAILPRETVGAVGYITGMELAEVLAWINARLKALGRKDEWAEKQAGHPYAIRNIRKTVKNGHGSIPKTSTLADLAEVLGEAPAGLLKPLKPIKPKTPRSPRQELSDLEKLRVRLAEVRQEEAEILSAIRMIEQVRRAG